MNTLDHPFRVGDRVRYIHERRYCNANVVARLHCVSRVYWGSKVVFGQSMPMIELIGVENKLGRRHGMPDFCANAFRLVARPGGVTA